MAFNFNWSPLSADPTFYTRAQDLLTNALNKSPKPPIIVDDIIVSELNLGSVPPELEILEVGDMAEDRFRGIFKMRYAGDAFLTLKTRVQANPMNTYLSTSARFSSFASPEPLAAGSSLTIPIKITLSDIKLSAFIILVFSRSKGLTLVFRNDPLESLKVSSTFDSIPFVRDFLQRTIEQQLRNLLMEDVPAIIHRLSLRWFVPEFRAQEEALASAKEREENEEDAADPFSSPPQDPVDMNGNPLGTAEITAMALDGHTDTPSVFSQSSLLRLAALTDSHRTLSPFTPTMKDVLFRVWAGRAEQVDVTGFVSPLSAALSRKQSQVDLKGTTYTFSNASETASLPSRPSLVHTSSSFNRSNLSSTKSGKPRKRKHRTINLRKKVDSGDLPANIDEISLSETASTVTSDSASHPGSAPGSAQTLPTSFGTPDDRLREGEVATPPASPEVKRGKGAEKTDAGKTPQRLRDFPDRDDDPTIRRPQPRRALFTDSLVTPEKQIGSSLRHSSRSPQPVSPVDLTTAGPSSSSSSSRRPRPSRYFQSFNFPTERPSSPFIGSSPDSNHHQHHNHGYYGGQQQQQQQQNISAPYPYGESAAPGGILEQAWMMKMAGEIAKRMHEQQQQQQEEERKRVNSSRPQGTVAGGGDRQARSPPPPPYAA